MAQYGPKLVPSWRRRGQDGQDKAQTAEKQPYSKTSQKTMFYKVEAHRKAQTSPTQTQDGPRSGEDGQDGRKLARAKREIAEDAEDELEDAAQDR